MKHILLALTFLLSTYFSFGQCGPYTLTASDSSCTYIVLKVSGAAGAGKIVWSYNGTPTDSLFRAPTGPVTSLTSLPWQAGSSEMIYPTSVFIDSTGYIYVSDLGSNSILRFPPGSTTATYDTSIVYGYIAGSGPNQFSSPEDVTVDHAGNIYVADMGNNRIQKYSSDSALGANAITVAGLQGGNLPDTAANQLSYPVSIAIDSAGYIYVSDQGNNRVIKFPPNSTQATNGVVVAGGNGPGRAANQLYSPYRIFLDRSGSLYVCDYMNDRIQKFPAGSSSATSGITVAGGNGSGNAANQLNGPIGIYVDSSGNMYVADERNSRVQKFPAGSTYATNGVIVAGGNGLGSAPDQFSDAVGLFVDQSGKVYVPDYGNSRVQVWSQPLTYGIDTALIVISGGSYSATITDTFGCTSTTNIFTTTPYGFNISQDICQGSTYSFAGRTLTSTGTYYNYLVSSTGCDSTITLTLTVHAPLTNHVSDSICPGGSFAFDSHTLSVPGTYADTLISMYGCDSIVILALSARSGIRTTISQSICPGSFYAFNGQLLSVAGNYSDTLIASTGCDSLVTLNLTLFSKAVDTISAVICPGSVYTFGAGIYAAAGIYNDTLANASASGCDSIVALHLNILTDSLTASFTLQPSATTAHLWYIVNQCTGTALSYLWHWGDGTTSTGDTPSHTYSIAGYYNVCVTATDSMGCSASYCDTNAYLFKTNGQMVYVNVVNQVPSGIQTIDINSLNIAYYNNDVHFSSPLQSPTDIKLYDLSGRVVQEQNNFTGNSWPIDQSIAAGVYVLSQQSDGNTLSKKLMIIH